MFWTRLQFSSCHYHQSKKKGGLSPLPRVLTPSPPMTPPPPALWPSTQEARGLVASLLQRWDLGELHGLPHSPSSGRAFNPKEVLQAPGLGGPLLVRWTDGWAIARWPSALGLLKWAPLSFLGLRLLSWAPPPQAPPTLSCCRGAGHAPGLVPPVPRCSLALVCSHTALALFIFLPFSVVLEGLASPSSVSLVP